MSKQMKHTILAVMDSLIRKIHVPEWGMDVYLKTLTVSEAIAYLSAIEHCHDEKVHALACAYALCDEEGNRLFTEDDVDDLCTRNPAVLKRLVDEALDLNQLNHQGDKERQKNANPTVFDESVSAGGTVGGNDSLRVDGEDDSQGTQVVG